MEYKKIDHIAIAVKNLEKSIVDYKKMGFSLSERRKTEGKKTGMISAVMISGGVKIVLLQGTSAESQVSKFVEAYGAGVHHMAFEVVEIEKAHEELKGNGIEFDTSVIDGGTLKQCFSTREPNSKVMIELIERTSEENFNSQNIQNLFEELETKGNY